MKTITYKGRGITLLFPSGYYEVYSNRQGRFIKCDTLSAAKQITNEDEL